MPAHFRAAIAAYLYLACREESRPVPWYFATPVDVPNSKEDYARIACAGKESTFEFIFDIIDELVQIFRLNISILVVMKLQRMNGKNVLIVNREY